MCYLSISSLCSASASDGDGRNEHLGQGSCTRTQWMKWRERRWKTQPWLRVQMGHCLSWEGGCSCSGSSRAQELFMNWLLAGKAVQPWQSLSLKWLFRQGSLTSPSDGRHDVPTPWGGAATVPLQGLMGTEQMLRPWTRTANIRLVASVGATPPLHFLAWVISAPCFAFLLDSLSSKREGSLPLGRERVAEAGCCLWEGFLSLGCLYMALIFSACGGCHWCCQERPGPCPGQCWPVELKSGSGDK